MSRPLAKDERKPERIRARDAALIVGVSDRTMQQLAAHGQIPGAAKLGGVWTFDERRLRAWVREKEGEAWARGERRKGATGAAASCGRASWSTVRNTEEAYARAMSALLSAGEKNGASA